MEFSIKGIRFQDAGYMIYWSLSAELQLKAIKLLRLVKKNRHASELNGLVYLVDNLTPRLYAIALSDDLRIVIEFIEKDMRVVDILSMRMAHRYFGKPA
jgi:hypothetical protein